MIPLSSRKRGRWSYLFFRGKIGKKTQDLQNKMIKATILNKSPLVDQLIHFHYEENLFKKNLLIYPVQ